MATRTFGPDKRPRFRHACAALIGMSIVPTFACQSLVSSETCEQRAEQARSLLANAVASADLSCSVDADCSLADNDSDCSGGCGVLVNRAGAAALAAAIKQADQHICPSAAGKCQSFAIPCGQVGVGLAACIAGTCMNFPPADWTSFALERQAVTDSEGIPPSCTTTDCVLWTVTPDGQVTTVTRGLSHTATLSGADFASIDALLRSESFRKLTSMGGTCDVAPPSGPRIALVMSWGPSVGFDATGCVLGSPGIPALQAVYQLLQAYPGT